MKKNLKKTYTFLLSMVIAVISLKTSLAFAEGYVDSSMLLDESNIPITSGQVYDLSSNPNATAIQALTEGSIIIEYTSTSNNQYQSLFSVSNATTGNRDRHFHIYITPSGTLGMELRNTDSIFKYTLSRPSSLRWFYKGTNARNTIAFKGDRTNGTYKIFANGGLIATLNKTNFKFFNDISGLTNVTLGGTIREGAVAYPFGGTIHKVTIYDDVLTDDELISLTASTTYGAKIFNDKDATNSNYFRIPSLLTLSNGTIVSAIDARYGGTHDSKSNIDTAFTKSTDGGVTWSSPTLPFYFDDYLSQKIDWPTEVGARDLQIQGSASFIDPVLVENAQTGRIFLFIDVMPAGIGSSNASVGSGYKIINGKKYLKLRWYQDASNTYNYSVRENGVIYNDITKQPTEYTMNTNYEIVKSGTPLTVKQYQVRITNGLLYEEKNLTDVKMNVFYKDSYFKIYPTSYLAMKYSDNQGDTWSDMILLNTLKSDYEKLLITGPGVGIQNKKGTYQGRIVVPVYTITEAGFGVVYSDDNGATWTLGKGPNEGSAATAEAQVVEMPDGSLKVFERTGSGKIAMCSSLDGGATWQNRVLIDQLPATSYGTQVSVINYSGLIDGKHAIILSAPASDAARKDGRIRIGLITDTGLTGVDKYRIDWTYNFAVDGSQIGYSYTCLTELPNGNIGVLYEKYDSWSRSELHLKNVTYYEEYTINELKSN